MRLQLCNTSACKSLSAVQWAPILVFACHSALLRTILARVLAATCDCYITVQVGISHVLSRSQHPFWCSFGHVMFVHNGSGTRIARNHLVTPVSGNVPSLRLTFITLCCRRTLSIWRCRFSGCLSINCSICTWYLVYQHYCTFFTAS